MKTILGTLTLVALMASCSKQNEEITLSTPPQEGGSKVELVFSAAKEQSRAFGTGTTEAWEKKVNSATIIACNKEGNIAVRKHLTKEQIGRAHV